MKGTLTLVPPDNEAFLCRNTTRFMLGQLRTYKLALISPFGNRTLNSTPFHSQQKQSIFLSLCRPALLSCFLFTRDLFRATLFKTFYFSSPLLVLLNNETFLPSLSRESQLKIRPVKPFPLNSETRPLPK